jgi:F-type H+-transporting ATPase subunit gamma
METKEIRRKIESVNNIRELTGALETLSALKMKKAQKIALMSRPFAQKITYLLSKLDYVLKEKKSVFLQEKEAKNILVLVVSSDRGFCGSFNQNIVKLAEKELSALKSKEVKIEILPIGKKGISFFKKKGYDFKFNFTGIGDYGELEELKPISDYLIKSFLENKFQKIYFVYTDFVSSLLQKPKIIQILPFAKENFKDFLKEEISKKEEEFIIEPSYQTLAEEIVPQLVEYLIYQCVLESNASEHSARMMAMRNASENAQKKVEELRLLFNKARQEQITREVCEISIVKEVLE